MTRVIVIVCWSTKEQKRQQNKHQKTDTQTYNILSTLPINEIECIGNALDCAFAQFRW